MDSDSLVKTKRPRSTAGCIGCRLRRKKCSEEKPHCANCVRNRILCTYPLVGNKKHDELLRRTNPTRRNSNSSSTRSRDGKRTGEDYSECSSPRTSRGSVAPSSPSSTVSDTVEGTLFDMAIVQVLSTFPRSLGSQIFQEHSLLKQPASRRLFHHYLYRTHKVMAICQGTKNPFLRELIPMAMSNDLILNGLLAFSGIHYADLTGNRVDEVTWLHYGQTIQGEKFGLTLLAQGRREALVPLLVTAMLLCIVETFRVDSGALALQHLRAARVLLQEALQLPESQLSRETRAFLIERYTYTMILAHITMGADSDQWVLNDTALLFPMMQSASSQYPGAMSGCVHELFYLIPKVSVLARAWRDGLRFGLDIEDLASQYMRLHTTIASWQPTSTDEVHLLCGRLYQQALLVYLASSFKNEEEFLEQGQTYSAPVQQAFDDFIAFLESIPLDSSISTTLCWPLAIFGSCARSAEHRSAIARRLDSLSATYAAQSVRDTKKLLELMWEEDNPRAANPLGFEDMMNRAKMTVLFL